MSPSSSGVVQAVNSAAPPQSIERSVCGARVGIVREMTTRASAPTGRLT
jgi:hypothetical protein